MVAGGISVCVNLVLNYILIFGKCNAPALGAAGAAIATVISRFVETAIILLWTHIRKSSHSFIIGIYRSFYIPVDLIKNIMIKGSPLMINEILWSLSITVLCQLYSTRGLAAVAAINICNTINNLFNVVFIAIGCSVGIIVGQLLGAKKMEEAKDTAEKMIVFAVAVCFITGVIMAVLAPLFPEFYNTTEEVKSLASSCIFIMAVLMPFCAFNHASYFTLRSGGQTFIAFLFDSCYMWVINIPAALIVSKTSASLVLMYAICQSLEITKCIMGYIFVKKGGWLKNIVQADKKYS